MPKADLINLSLKSHFDEKIVKKQKDLYSHGKQDYTRHVRFRLQKQVAKLKKRDNTV